MNWNHLRAMLWMRQRVLINRIRRASKLNSVLFLVLLVVGIGVSLGSFFTALILGVGLLPDAEPLPLMLTWLGLAAAFFFFWLIGLVTDLQRSDSMSFKNLLHLPISLGWVFLYNYFCSFVSISIALVLPAMLGLSLAMVLILGPWMLLSFPLVFAFFWMITAVTYQLRGWLSRLMEDKRRGRNIVAMITFGFVLLLQVPNLVNVSLSRARIADLEAARLETDALHPEKDESAPGEPEVSDDPESLETFHSAHEAGHEKLIAKRRKQNEQLDAKFSLGTMVVPLGWLPYGVRAAFEGRGLISALCAFGMLLIGAISLKWSFHTTLATYMGAGSNRVGASTSASEASAKPTPRTRKLLLVERRFPLLTEAESGVATACLRSILRAPESKLLLLSPVILLLLFGVMFTGADMEGMQSFSPLFTLAATMMGLLCIAQMTQNQFGMDRAGFRSYVLSPVTRAEILRGKNFGAAPIALVISVLSLACVQLRAPQDVLHLIGACFQAASIFLILCMIGNVNSIVFPMRLKPQGMKAANPGFKTVISQVVSVTLIPVAISPLLIPWGVEALFAVLGWPGGPLLYLALHAVAMLGTYALYGLVAKKQGAMLHKREQQILEVLTRE